MFLSLEKIGRKTENEETEMANEWQKVKKMYSQEHQHHCLTTRPDLPGKNQQELPATR